MRDFEFRIGIAHWILCIMIGDLDWIFELGIEDEDLDLGS